MVHLFCKSWFLGKIPQSLEKFERILILNWLHSVMCRLCFVHNWHSFDNLFSDVRLTKDGFMVGFNHAKKRQQEAKGSFIIPTGCIGFEVFQCYIEEITPLVQDNPNSPLFLTGRKVDSTQKRWLATTPLGINEVYKVRIFIYLANKQMTFSIGMTHERISSKLLLADICLVF